MTRCAAVCIAIVLSASMLRAQSPSPIDPDQTKRFAEVLKLDGVDSDGFNAVVVYQDLTYAQYGDKSLLLDLYQPKESNEPLPCVVVIVGGGFRTRSKTVFAPMAAYLAVNGFVAACIGYRGSPDETFPSAVHDTKAAVRYLRANAARLGIAPDRIAAFGQSAGGHLAGMLAVSGGVETLEGNGGHADQSSRIQCAVTFAGVFDFISRLQEGGQQKNGLESKRQSNGAWIGEPFSADSETWKFASPINHVTEDDPPILMIHCRGDSTVPVEQSIQMHKAITQFNSASGLVILEQGAHGILQNDAANDQAWQHALAFLRKVLYPEGHESTSD